MDEQIDIEDFLSNEMEFQDDENENEEIVELQRLHD